MPLRAAVVDDEPLAREKLRGFLARLPGFSLAGEAADGLAAIALIERERPDLVLLDIQMPELDGFEVLTALDPAAVPYVIFVTAYDHYAVKAFEVGAVDYLLKPVAPDRFEQAMTRAEREILGGGAGALAERLARALEAAAPARPRLDRFLIRERERSRFVSAAEVDWIEAAGNYLKLHTRDGIHLLRGTLKDLLPRLDPGRFARIHRTTIVNLERVRYLEPWSHGDQVVVLERGERLTLSRRFRNALPRTLGDAG